ncbi:ATP synthase regulation protein NCA2-domain-containing protein [Absidia repens]|uniref:ATP synthase regulation protein NCA2-domain-containing protein n=1 Tax=Absidia repens TaxID=90262 RepID=A0A1X2IDN3_9FUNG|nr:ATP synthase regulation protein NCA2-domain-containing protein [Absidia repens]
MEDISTYLTWYASLKKDIENDETDDTTLDWLFVTKCTLAAYGHILSSILQSTLPLSESLAYWDSIYGNSWYEAYYGIQSKLKKQISLIHVFRKLYNVPLPLALIHDEIQQKRTTLRSFRTQQATTLGLLIKQAPRFDSADNDSGISKQQQQSVSIDHVARDTIEESSKAFTLTSTSPFHVAHNLKKVVDQQPLSQNYLHEWKKEYGPSSTLTRYWIPGLIVLFGGKMAISYVFERKEDIVAWTNDGIQTVRGFFVNWLWEPMLRVLDTIRFKDQRIGLSSKEGLKSDLQSLERMVVEFARAHYHLSDAEITTLASQVRDGDISRVLIAYENEIKNPLRNAIRGDLIQSLLIQVQKTKVDVDMAMQALDKLLKSNELNFAFLAVAPSMLLTWASVSWLKNIYQRRDGNRIRQYGQPLKNTLR